MSTLFNSNNTSEYTNGRIYKALTLVLDGMKLDSKTLLAVEVLKSLAVQLDVSEQSLDAYSKPYDRVAFFQNCKQFIEEFRNVFGDTVNDDQLVILLEEFRNSGLAA